MARTTDGGVALATEDAQVLVVDTSVAFRTEMQYLLGDVAVVEAAKLDELDLDDPHAPPTVLVLGPSHARPAGLAKVEELVQLRPDLGALLVVRKLATGVLQTALRAGVKDVVSLPLGEDDLLAAVQRVAHSLRPRHPRAANREPGRLVTVFSAKGGAGTSVLAVNLAAALARRPDAPVALVDLDLQFGDAALLMGLKPDHTIADTIGTDVDGELVDKLLLGSPGGVRLLASPLDPVLAGEVSPDTAMYAISALRQTFAHVVVDTASYLDDLAVNVIEASDVVIVVAGCDVPSVKAAKLTLQALAALPVPEERIRLVLNHVRPHAGVSMRDVERALDRKVDAVIPADDAVPRSVNRGEPAVLHSPDAPASRAINDVARRLAPVAGGEAEAAAADARSARRRDAKAWLGALADRLNQAVTAPRPNPQIKED